MAKPNVNIKILAGPAFAADGVKRRSEIKQHAAIFDRARSWLQQYEGTRHGQKPVAVMTWLLLEAGQAAE